MTTIKSNTIDCDICEETFTAGELLCSHLSKDFTWGIEKLKSLPPPLSIFVQTHLRDFNERQKFRELQRERRRIWYKTRKDQKPEN